MRTIRLGSWSSFKLRIGQWCANRHEGSEPSLWFRGQADSRWSLKATLDRGREFPSASDRTKHALSLLDEFRRQLVGLLSEAYRFDDDALELLARHHGLPTRLLDWSTSPYIAAFFAFEMPVDAKRVAVWMLDSVRGVQRMDSMQSNEVPPIEFVADRCSLHFNVRAVEQQGVFLRVRSADRPLDETLNDVLVKIELPTAVRAEAIFELERMNITARNLFRDLDGAARTARIKAET